MKPTIKVLVVANNTPWPSWSTKVAALQAFFAPVATLQIAVIHTTNAVVPFVSFVPSGTQYETVGAVVQQVDPTWYKTNITPLAKGYDVSLLVLPETQWPLLDCMRGTTQVGVPKPIPCQVGADENEAVYQNGNMLFPTALHYMEHELCHALFSIAGIPFAQDTTHYWDFNQKNLPGVLTDIKFTPMAIPIPVPTAENPDVLYPDWSTQGRAYHNTRVLCDLAGMTLERKNLMCQCIYQESEFKIGAIGKPNSNGTLDFGICQFNNGVNAKGVPLWIGPGAFFENTEEVLTNPTKCVNEMIAQFELGHENWWSSYSTGAYKQWGAANSPMWALASTFAAN